ncbi:MAG TPA: septum formation initiator family protein [Candidatus Egerieicola pullicola]|uniref:Septum formation initiator family protein n=1 Tax=Candidatus Egerieicola pullicola TaxID=2840775 RepID=A0A9D1AK09_9FIRM|nr:septum formation initiator family protein [Candidatus Egerieicola pullicola]
MAATKKRKRRIVVIVAVIAITIYVGISMVFITNSYREKSQEIQQVQQQIDEQTVLNQEYQAMIDQGVDDEYIQKLAREKLGLVYPDERVYIDMGG